MIVQVIVDQEHVLQGAIDMAKEHVQAKGMYISCLTGCIAEKLSTGEVLVTLREEGEETT